MMRKKTAGSVVFVSSVAALDGSEGQTTYAASKAALLGAMRSMAIELGPHGIRVNMVAPGVIRTPMTEKLTDEAISRKIRLMDIKRMGEPAEIADIFVYLMSELSSHVTGQTIRIDGGIRS